MAIDVQTVRERVNNPTNVVDILEALTDQALAKLSKLPDDGKIIVPLRDLYLLSDEQLEILRRRYKLSGWHLNVWYLDRRKKLVNVVTLEPSR